MIRHLPAGTVIGRVLCITCSLLATSVFAAPSTSTRPAEITLEELMKTGPWILSTDERSAAKQFSAVIRTEPGVDGDPADSAAIYVVRDGDRVGYVIAGADGLPVSIVRTGTESVHVGMASPGHITVARNSPRVVAKVDQGRINLGATGAPEDKPPVVDLDVPSILSFRQSMRMDSSAGVVEVAFRSGTGRLLLSDDPSLAFKAFSLTDRTGRRTSIEVVSLGRPPLDIFTFGRRDLEKAGLAIDDRNVNTRVAMEQHLGDRANRVVSRRLLNFLAGDTTVLKSRPAATQPARTDPRMAQALNRGSWILSNDNRSASQRFHIVIRFDPSATRPAEHPFLCYIARDGDKIGCAWFTKDGFLLGLLREHMGVRINENEPGALAVLAGRPFLVLRGDQSGIEYEATLWPEMKRGIVDIDVASVLQRATEVRAGTQPQDLMLRIDGLSAIVTLAREGGGIAYDRVELNSPGGERIQIQQIGVDGPGPLDILSWTEDDLRRLGVPLDAKWVSGNAAGALRGEPIRKLSQRLRGLLGGELPVPTPGSTPPTTGPGN